ncbi:Tol-Pal system protein TolQ [subsurface metagenome]
MHKTFLLKTVFLIGLAVLVIALIAALHSQSGGSAAAAGQSQTLFEQFVVAGGPIVWLVLLPMSLVAVYLAVEYCLSIRRERLVPRGVGGGIIEQMQRFGAGQLPAKIAEQDDFVSTAVVRAINKGGGDWFRMRNLLFESLQEQALRLGRRIEWLNLIGNVSPMVGLFGTVFGMIKLFNAIVIAGGQPQPAQLAEGISVALVTTLWGLFIAIPSLAIHGVFANRIETLLSDAMAEAENILTEMRGGLKKPSAAQQPKPKQMIREVAGKPSPQVDKSVPLR